MKRLWRLSLVLLAGHVLAGPASAQSSSSLSFEQARMAMAVRPQGSTASEADLRAAEHQANAVRNLHRPTVIASVSALVYEKTLVVDTRPAKQQLIEGANDYLHTLPGQFPPEFSSIAALVAGRVEQAIPGLMAPIADELDYTVDQRVVRPNLTAMMPLYSGGAIPAIRDAANAGVELAQGRLELSRAGDLVRISQHYFGRQLAMQLRLAAEDTLAANERHLQNTRAMQRNGLLPRAAVLEVTVLRDGSQRALDRAVSEESVSALALARATGVPAQTPLSTPLFVNRNPLPPIETFTTPARLRGNGQTRVADAQLAFASAGVAMARSSLRPKVNAFASYNFARKQSLPVDPDWMAGVTVSFPVLTSIDRSQLVSAARARQESARIQRDAAADRVIGEIERSYALAEQARRSMFSMQSSLAAARENLRVQEIAYREGEGTASRLLDAQALLASARGQRAAAAYEYTLALAALLAATGQEDQFNHYATRDDRITIDAGD